LLAATVRSFAHMPLGISDRNNILPSIEQISAAENNLKNNKEPGSDGIPAEILKYDGKLLLERLHSFISSASTPVSDVSTPA